MDLEKSFSRHARRASFVLPSKRFFREFQAAAPSPTQPTSWLSCARTVICADRSVMTTRRENRLLLALFEASCSFACSGQCAESRTPMRGDPLHDASPPPTHGDRPGICTCRCCHLLGEKQWRKSPPRLRNCHAPQTSSNWCYARNA